MDWSYKGLSPMQKEEREEIKEIRRSELHAMGESRGLYTDWKIRKTKRRTNRKCSLTK